MWLAVEQINGCCEPASRAGGARLPLVIDVRPDAWEHFTHRRGVARTVLGAALMLARGTVLGV